MCLREEDIGDRTDDRGDRREEREVNKGKGDLSLAVQYELFDLS
jgi:hypothetical protein